MPTEGNTYYPPPKFAFQVNFNGAGIQGESSFQEVSGLKVGWAKQKVKEAGGAEIVHQLPTHPQFSNLVLKRGFLTDSSVRTWAMQALSSYQFTPIQITVSLLNSDGTALQSWVFYNAWPVSWEVDTFNSTENAVLIESMEIAYTYFE